MASATTSISRESTNKNRARIAAAIFSVFLFFFILYPFWSYTFPPPGQQGIIVSFGDSDEEGSENIASTQNVSNPDQGKEDQTTNSSPKADQNTSQQKSSNQSQKLNDQDLIVEKGEIKASPSDISSSENAEKNIDKPTAQEVKAMEEARRKAEYESAKKQFGEIIGKGIGNEEGTNKGDPKGEPNVDVLEGISKGRSKIGGGLENRGVVFEPEIEENSQKSGKVVVRVCVNNRGEVIESKYTQKGSTTTDLDLIQVAQEGAKRYQFSKSPLERQCGTITIEFKLK